MTTVEEGKGRDNYGAPFPTLSTFLSQRFVSTFLFVLKGTTLTFITLVLFLFSGFTIWKTFVGLNLQLPVFLCFQHSSKLLQPSSSSPYTLFKSFHELSSERCVCTALCFFKKGTLLSRTHYFSKGSISRDLIISNYSVTTIRFFYSSHTRVDISYIYYLETQFTPDYILFECKRQEFTASLRDPSQLS